MTAAPTSFSTSKQMGKVLHGDRALVRVTGIDRKGRPEGAIVEVPSAPIRASSAAC
jgi:exoribonuclease R